MGKVKTKKTPKRGVGKTMKRVDVYQYRLQIGGDIYEIHSANPLNTEFLKSKKEGEKAEITGKELVTALNSYKSNPLMPGIETFTLIYKVTERPYNEPGKDTVMVEEKRLATKDSPEGHFKAMMKLLNTWKEVGMANIEFQKKANVPKSKLPIAFLEINEFTGKKQKVA